MILTEELREELNQAAFATTQAFAVARSTPQVIHITYTYINTFFLIYGPRGTSHLMSFTSYNCQAVLARNWNCECIMLTRQLYEELAPKNNSTKIGSTYSKKCTGPNNLTPKACAHYWLFGQQSSQPTQRACKYVRLRTVTHCTIFGRLLIGSLPFANGYCWPTKCW